MGEFLYDGPPQAAAKVVMAHGSGAPMDSPFMTTIASGLALKGVRVARFEFPYMRKIRESGKKRPPDRTPILREAWLEVLHELGPGWVIGGKSLGGRMASYLADEVQAPGLLCLGYPFHAPGNPEKLRTEHLAELRTPTLILQGTRDAFGTRAEVCEYELSEQIQLGWLEAGDHSFEPTKASGRSSAENFQQAIDWAAEFITSC